jgi:hypothetical protein
MLSAFIFALCQAAPPAQPAVAATWVAAAPALAVKAPGAPGYGLQITTKTGKVLLTNLSFDPDTRKPQARFYWIHGPAGWGPYRSGLEECLSYTPARPIPTNPGKYDTEYAPSFYENHFTFTQPTKGSPAEAAGLENSRWGRLRLDAVDGSNFGWDTNALIFHITQNPNVTMQIVKLPGFALFSPSYKTYTLKNRRVDTPPDPADAVLENAPANEEVKAWLTEPRPWNDLLTLRSQQAASAPLALDLSGRRLWAVLAQGQPSQDKPPRMARSLEFWREDPRAGAFDTGLLDVWPEPGDGFRVGRTLRIGDRWYRLQAMSQDPATGRLSTLSFRPWEANVPALLGGSDLASELGPQKTATLREALEQVANETLLEWKTRALPAQLRSQEASSLEDLVIRIEKGLLLLDRQVRGIRQRLDAQARSLAAQQALADKPGAAPQATPTTATQDSEGLADLLDQRKAILMAILGSAKQALSTLRR